MTLIAHKQGAKIGKKMQKDQSLLSSTFEGFIRKGFLVGWVPENLSLGYTTQNQSVMIDALISDFLKLDGLTKKWK